MPVRLEGCVSALEDRPDVLLFLSGDKLSDREIDVVRRIRV
jgi:hypothetical protein